GLSVGPARSHAKGARVDRRPDEPPNEWSAPATITDEDAQAAAAEVLEQIDEKNGGLKGGPKFPSPDAAGFTLERIAASGLHDHVGGGFFRYTVDAEWKIPHFKKMLYDNALLISLYSERYRSEASVLHRDLVRRTIEWLLGEMRGAD